MEDDDLVSLHTRKYISIGVDGEMSKRNVEVNVAINSMQWNVKYIFIAPITFDWHTELNAKTGERETNR